MALWMLVFSLLAAPHEPYQRALLPSPTPEHVKALAALGLELKRGPTGLVAIGPRSAVAQAQALGIPLVVEIEDLEAWASARMSGRGDFGNYYTYAEAVTKMNQLASQYPQVVTPPQSIGTSHQGNTIWAMKVSDNPSLDEEEPAILFTGVHHAREPIGCTLCLDFIEYLASHWGADPVCTFLVNEREFWFVPIVNPDGYLYNESTNPSGGGYWRKNRRPNPDGSFGVDLNRNYTFMWGYDNVGSSPTPSSETYRGPSPGSEPEVQAIMALCRAQGFVEAQHWHSYSNLFLYPWGYADILTPDDEAFDRLASEATFGIGYDSGTAWELLYNTNGDANDWGYGDTSKPKVFSCTAEIGEDFWQESQIPAHIQEGRQIALVQSLFAGPLASLEAVQVQDQGGDGRLDPGEQATVTIHLRNKGFSGNGGLQGHVIWADPSLQVQPLQISFSPFPALSVVAGTPVQVTVAPQCPPGSVVRIRLALTGQWMMPDTVEVPLQVGRPFILLVDSDNEPTETRLVEALRRVPLAFDTWYQPANPVSLDLLRRYRLVVWTAGDQNTSSIPGPDRQALASYLDLGGALLLSAENYLTSYASDPFTTQYLHVSGHTTNISVSSVQGVAGDPVTSGMAFGVSYPAGLNSTPDAVVPDAQAAGILRVNNGSTFTALRYPASGTSTYRVIFTATPLEALVPSPTPVEALLQAMVTWLLQSSDQVAPSPVTGLQVSPGPLPQQVTLSWSPSLDNVGVMYYRVYEATSPWWQPLPSLWRDVATGPTCVRPLPQGAGTLFWRITAVDAAGNESSPSGAGGAFRFGLTPGGSR